MKTGHKAKFKQNKTIDQKGIEAGIVVTLPVIKEAEFGYFLQKDEQEILLHRNEATRPLQQGDEVEVFLYHDHENRVAATMEMPIVQMGTYEWLQVVDVSPRLGVFLHNGMKKDLLLFIDDLPKRPEEWPQKGDHLLVTLKKDKRGRIVADLATEKEIHDFAVPAGKELHNKQVEGTVYKIIGEGVFLMTTDAHILFIHRDEMTAPLHLGQSVECRVSFVREDGKLNGSMFARKAERYVEDAKLVLDYLAERGAMPITDDSTPEQIKEVFHISKGAFKRAMGKLMKDGLIEQEDGWTHLKREVYLERLSHLDKVEAEE